MENHIQRTLPVKLDRASPEEEISFLIIALSASRRLL
jgi:hypothetical protein